MTESIVLPPSAPPPAPNRLGLLGAWGPWWRGVKVRDWSGKDVDGTLSGNATIGGPTRFGQAMTFDGDTTSHVDLGTPAHLAGRVVDFTVTSRFVCTASAWNPIYAAYQATTGGKLWAMFRIESTSNVLAYYTVAVGGGFANYAMTAGDAIQLGAVNFAALAVQGPASAPAGRFYLNGKYTPFAMSPIGTPDTTVPICIGGDVFGEGFNGRIAEVRVYDRELSEAELRREYQDPWWFTRSAFPLAAVLPQPATRIFLF